MATTQCPACSKVIEHRPEFIIAVMYRDLADDSSQTSLIANHTLALHVCVSTHKHEMSVY
jgi:hypothetical protein